MHSHFTFFNGGRIDDFQLFLEINMGSLRTEDEIDGAFCSMQCAVRRNAMHIYKMQCNAIQSSEIKCNEMQYNAVTSWQSHVQLFWSM